jgi:hypothetical protein
VNSRGRFTEVVDTCYKIYYIDSKDDHNNNIHPLINGCTKASLGVILLAGSRERHLSSKSMKDTNNLFSSSLSLTDEGGISRARKSRDGLEI